MAPATPPRPSLSGEEEGSKARDRPKRDQPEAPGSDDGAGCKRPRLVLPDPAADEGATPRRHLAFLDPAADEGATPRRHLAFLDPAADEGATPRHHLAFLDPAADEGTTPRRHLPFLDPAADKGATPRHHLPFLDPAADKGALLPGVQTFPSGPGVEERGSRGRARSREEVGTNGDKEVSRGHAQGREEGALSPNLSFLHLNAGEGADAVVHDNSSGRGGSGYGKGDKFENGAEAQEEILEKFENGQEGLQPQAHEEISKSEEILEKFENSKEGSRLLVQEVSMNEAVLDLEKEQMKEDLPDPLQSLEYALLDEFATMHGAYYSIELLQNELMWAGAANLTPALRDAAENAWRFIKDRLPVCRALIRRIREANGPSYSVPEIYLQ